MHRDNLLLLESFFCIEQYRQLLPTLIFSLSNQQGKETTALLNAHILELSNRLGVKLEIDREALIKVIKKERKLLLGRLRVLNARSARRV